MLLLSSLQAQTLANESQSTVSFIDASILESVLSGTAAVPHDGKGRSGRVRHRESYSDAFTSQFISNHDASVLASVKNGNLAVNPHPAQEGEACVAPPAAFLPALPSEARRAEAQLSLRQRTFGLNTTALDILLWPKEDPDNRAASGSHFGGNIEAVESFSGQDSSLQFDRLAGEHSLLAPPAPPQGPLGQSVDFVRSDAQHGAADRASNGVEGLFQQGEFERGEFPQL